MATLAAEAPPSTIPANTRHEVPDGEDAGQEGPSLDSSRLALLCQGAEARVWEGTFLGRPAIVKQRFRKRYRHPTLDAKLTSQRLKQEVRSMLRARKLGVPTPALYHVDMDTACIYMERLQGHSVKSVLQGGGDGAPLDAAASEVLVRQIAVLVAQLHDGGVVHGDLTTSNVLAVAHSSIPEGAAVVPQWRVVVIDFGLSFFSSLPEDRAVDLYVLERAFTSAHAEAGGRLFEAFLESYRRRSRNWCSTLNKFAEVRMRGRKRTMVG